MTDKPKENWGGAEAYEKYVGRWSRLIAQEFLAWIAVPSQAAWADVGCGTGALAECILAQYDPKFISGIDKADGFVAAARQIKDRRVSFETGDATALPWNNHTFDVAVSGLVLNFVPDHNAMAKEMVRVTKPGGKVAAYVWDYAEGMEMMRHFWDVAIEVSPDDSALDQAERFPICRPEALQELFHAVGLRSVSSRAIEVPTVFRSFDDYWRPFLGKQGAAPTYLASLDETTCEKIRRALESPLKPSADGAIHLKARAWAVQGIVKQN